MKHKVILSAILSAVVLFIAACTDNSRAYYLEAPYIETPSDFTPVELSALHVDGRYLKNASGEIVNLHGFAQSYSPYFNYNAWSNYDVDACLAYNQSCFDSVLAAGWKVTLVRQHMDPYWCSDYEGDESVVYKTFKVDDFMKYLNLVFIPMAEYAIERGVYVLMRPPGVSPETIAPGDAYNKYLVQVWDSISNHPRIKNNPGIMFELANEPVNIEGTDGSVGGSTDAQFEAMSNFLQPIVDVIRENGANNVVWLPGLGYQSWFCGFANHPVQGENLGYAVHCYPGWYGSDAEQDSGEGISTSTGGGYDTFQAGWDNQIGPVASMAPLIVTEMDWAAVAYNATWGKGITGEVGGSGFGANFKYITDNCGNVSWLIFTQQEYLMQFVDEPGEEGDYTVLNDPEACLWPVFHWYEEYASGGDAGTATVRSLTAKIGGTKYENDGELTMQTGSSGFLVVFSTLSDGTTKALSTSAYTVTSSNTKAVKAESGLLTAAADGEADVTISYTNGEEVTTMTVHITTTSFSLGDLNPSIYGEGTYNAETNKLITGPYGFGGWHYDKGLDLSDFNYLVVELSQGTNISGDVSFRIYDEDSYWATPAMFAVKDYRLIVNLKDQQLTEGEVADPSHIYYIGFWTPGGESNKVIINRIYPTNTYPADEYVAPEPPEETEDETGGDAGGETGDGDSADDYAFPLSDWKFLFNANDATTFNTSTGEIIAADNGAVGWDGLWNMKDYRYLIVELDEKSDYEGTFYSFRLFDDGYWNNCADFPLSTSVVDNKIKIDLTKSYNVTDGGGNVLRVLDLSKINVIAFWGMGTQKAIYVKKVYLTNKDE